MNTKIRDPWRDGMTEIKTRLAAVFTTAETVSESTGLATGINEPVVKPCGLGPRGSDTSGPRPEALQPSGKFPEGSTTAVNHTPAETLRESGSSTVAANRHHRASKPINEVRAETIIDSSVYKLTSRQFVNSPGAEFRGFVFDDSSTLIVSSWHDQKCREVKLWRVVTTEANRMNDCVEFTQSFNADDSSQLKPFTKGAA